jgi:hypothetical protein
MILDAAHDQRRVELPGEAGGAAERGGRRAVDRCRGLAAGDGPEGRDGLSEEDLHGARLFSVAPALRAGGREGGRGS